MSTFDAKDQLQQVNYVFTVRFSFRFSNATVIKEFGKNVVCPSSIPVIFQAFHKDISKSGLVGNLLFC